MKLLVFALLLVCLEGYYSASFLRELFPERSDFAYGRDTNIKIPFVDLQNQVGVKWNLQWPTSSQPQGNGYQPQGNVYQQQGYGYQPQGNGYQPQGYGYQPQGYGYQPQGNGYQPQGYGYQPQGNEYQPSKLQELAANLRALYARLRANRQGYGYPE